MTHPNDMTHWPKIVCQREHDHHDTLTTSIHLGGPTPYADYPPIPDRFDIDLTMDTWVNPEPDNPGGPYCPANDTVSETLQTLGVWEPPETTALLCVFERVGSDAAFIDVGAQLGYYSCIAAGFGLSVIAFEADPDVAGVCADNIDRIVQPGQPWGVINERVVEGAPQVHVADDEVAIVKIDVEGAEPEAIDMLAQLFAAGRVDYALIEISPTFHDRYGEMMLRLLEWEMHPYLLPDKATPPERFDTLDDLREGSMPEILARLQTNVLFVNGRLIS